MTEAQFSYWGLHIGIPVMILYMLFIVYDLAKQSKAGIWAYIVLFSALAVGMLGFVIKGVIIYFMKV